MLISRLLRCSPQLARQKLPCRRGYTVFAACPQASCSCRPTPAGLDIDRKLQLDGTVPAYHEQVLISTGKDDWTSRIEDDESGGLARELKTLLGPKGKYFDPYRNIILTCASFPSQGADQSPQRPFSDPSNRSVTASSIIASDDSTQTASSSVFLFPSFLHIPRVAIDVEGATSLIQQHLLPSASRREKLGAAPKAPSNENELERRPIENIVVLICSHGSRDTRCGVLGPLIQQEFVEQLGNAGLSATTSLGSDPQEKDMQRVVVGSISHIGGHRWAGNVIIYIPPSMQGHPLAGRGIWYGRVEPSHVEGIVYSTIRGGAIIRELFRGGIDLNRSRLSLPREESP